VAAAYHVHFNYDIKSRARFEMRRGASARAVDAASRGAKWRTDKRAGVRGRPLIGPPSQPESDAASHVGKVDRYPLTNGSWTTIERCGMIVDKDRPRSDRD